jgi:ribonuclease D
MPAEHMTAARAISREAVNQLPIQRYPGEIRLLASAEGLADFLADLRGETVVGFDTETRPSFHKGESYPPALAQVATSRCVYLLPLLHLDCGEALVTLLNDAGIVKAGVALAGDLAGLRERYPCEPRGIVDLGRVARAHGHAQSGLRNLAASLLGWRIAKTARTSNWAAAQLTPAQIGYAATDAWVSRELYLCFQRQIGRAHV